MLFATLLAGNATATNATATTYCIIIVYLSGSEIRYLGNQVISTYCHKAGPSCNAVMRPAVQPRSWSKKNRAAIPADSVFYYERQR